MVFESIYLDGMTGLMTSSITSRRRSSNVTLSECCVEMTTVCTRRGRQAPLSKQYSQVTFRNNFNEFQTADHLSFLFKITYL